jgi:hypothetical protein
VTPAGGDDDPDTLPAQRDTQPGEPARPRGPRIPCWGYYYRIVTAQGAHASGGAYDYVVRDHTIGGFALIASDDTWTRF